MFVLATALLMHFGKVSAQNNHIIIADSTVAETSKDSSGWTDCGEVPVVLKRAAPLYPELTLRAGLEGKVWVKILVDEQGKPSKVVVVKSDEQIFNKAAIEAARQFLFVPVTISSGPVALWVTVPFKFSLAEGKDVQTR